MILAHAHIYALYGQVALLDAENPDAYYQFETGDELLVFGKHGVVVATVPYIEIETTVILGTDPTAERCTAKSVLTVGTRGLVLGNEVAADTNQVPLHEGVYQVSVYTNNDRDNVTRVLFRLQELSIQ